MCVNGEDTGSSCNINDFGVINTGIYKRTLKIPRNILKKDIRRSKRRHVSYENREKEQKIEKKQLNLLG